LVSIYMKNSKLILYAFVQSVGIFIYTSGVAWFLFNGERFFGKTDSFWQPLSILLLLVVSAAVTGSLVFVKPIYLYLEGLKKEAIKLLIYTILSLFLITSIAFTLAIFFSK
jgi:hypothetical protein